MTINNEVIRWAEIRYEIKMPDDLRKYLEVKYAEEPWPYEYSEQDLQENIRKDIRAYQKGQLDVAIPSVEERLHAEIEWLKELYIKSLSEANEKDDYIAKLEEILRRNRLASSRMTDDLVWNGLPFD